jgi:hypothetical protein
MTLTAVGLVYVALGFVLWVHAWSAGATTHTLCGCGDPALFTWFFQWPATALAHGENPFFSTALFHPGGINLLAQTSVTGLSIPLVPVTWIWGPVASLNVACTLTPAVTAFTAFVAVRRWAPWTPAAFVGGLLYGFSPLVLTSLEFAHLMTAALMLLPLILIALDEILLRQRHSAVWSGVLLGLLFAVQFFLSSELLALTALVAVLGVLVLVAAALVADRTELRRLAPHAATGLGVGVGVGAVLLVWPVWFALDGPAHLSGLVWPNVGVIGGFIPSSFVAPGYPPRLHSFFPLSGYEGAPLASEAYLGWSLLAVFVAGLVAFRRDRRLWFFGFLLVLCGVCSLGIRRGQWEPARLFDRLPVLDNVIQQRFMAIGFLAAAVFLAVLLQRVHALLPDWRGALGALAVGAVALVPMGVTFGGRLPFVMEQVVLPRWYAQVAPRLPPGRVLLSYPAPFSGVQSALTWQAVLGMPYSQAGGGGPQGVASRAGTAAAGFELLSALSLAEPQPPPAGSPTQLAAVRHALSVWEVNTVVVAPDPAIPPQQLGRDPVYAAAFMTAALGRPPALQAGAWVWNHVQLGLTHPLVLKAGTLAACSGAAERTSGGVSVATMQVANCVIAGVRTAP